MNNLPAVRRNVFKLILDITIFIVLLLSLDRKLTGKPVHEWLPIAGTAVIILHILLSWKWIETLVRKFFSRGPLKQKINFVLNWLLFIDWVLVMWSGIMISRVALPWLGIYPAGYSGWHWLHGQSADLLLFMLALHLALNWSWVANAVKSHILKPRGYARPEKKTTFPVVKEVQS